MSKQDKGDFETPPPTPYDGLSGIGRDSVWLTNEDLPHDKDTVLVIDGVNRRNNVKFAGGRMKEIFLSLRFRGHKRELGLNATNRKVLNTLFSSRCGEWAGKRVALYVQQGVRMADGTHGPAVRIRPKRMDQSATSEQADNPLLTDAPPAAPFDLPDIALAAIEQAETKAQLATVAARIKRSGFTGEDMRRIRAAWSERRLPSTPSPSTQT